MEGFLMEGTPSMQTLALGVVNDRLGQALQELARPTPGVRPVKRRCLRSLRRR
jgi:hypothetical protein